MLLTNKIIKINIFLIFYFFIIYYINLLNNDYKINSANKNEQIQSLRNELNIIRQDLNNLNINYKQKDLENINLNNLTQQQNNNILHLNEIIGSKENKIVELEVHLKNQNHDISYQAQTQYWKLIYNLRNFARQVDQVLKKNDVKIPSNFKVFELNLKASILPGTFLQDNDFHDENIEQEISQIAELFNLLINFTAYRNQLYNENIVNLNYQLLKLNQINEQIYSSLKNNIENQIAKSLILGYIFSKDKVSNQKFDSNNNIPISNLNFNQAQPSKILNLNLELINNSFSNLVFN